MLLTEYVRDVVEDRYDVLLKLNGYRGHWLWVGATDKDGYPKITLRKKTYGFHRLTWAHYNGNGKINDKKVVHHTCEVILCCNPEHLVLLTRKEHAAAHRTTYCAQGHNKNQVGRRSTGQCLECIRLSNLGRLWT